MSQDESPAIVEAIINKVQTTADGGARITLDIGYDARHIAAQLLQKKIAGNDLISIVFIDQTRGKPNE
jgi:hypothetical protein